MAVHAPTTCTTSHIPSPTRHQDSSLLTCTHNAQYSDIVDWSKLQNGDSHIRLAAELVAF